MAQRNPLNPRYQGEGPGGQTKKSAASAKPATEAASSVYKKSKPTTSSEKRAAAKAREKEMLAKNAEKSRKAAEKARLKAEAENGDAAPAVVKKKPDPSAGAPKNFIQKLFSPAPNMPDTPEYKNWRKRYWILMVAGIVSVILSWTLQMLYPHITLLWTVFMVLAYGFIALAFFVDFKKVRPLITKHQRIGTVAKSPKQVKHEKEAAERAAQLEAARKAARDATHKPLLRRKKKESDEQKESDV